MRDENGRLLRFMTLQEAEKLIRKRAKQSYTAADYVKAVAGPGYVKSLGLETKGNDAVYDASDSSSLETNGLVTGHEYLDSYISDSIYNLDSSGAQTEGSATRQGFAIGGHERLNRTQAHLSELTAAVYVCRVSPNHRNQGFKLLSLSHVSQGFPFFFRFFSWKGLKHGTLINWVCVVGAVLI